jgi:hypothetical protein
LRLSQPVETSREIANGYQASAARQSAITSAMPSAGGPAEPRRPAVRARRSQGMASARSARCAARAPTSAPETCATTSTAEALRLGA